MPSNTVPFAHVSWVPPLSCNSLQAYPSSAGVFFLSNDSGMTEIYTNKCSINNSEMEDIKDIKM